MAARAFHFLRIVFTRSPQLSLPENFTMYRPKFCAECGAKIIRLRWYFWTNRKFCGGCSPRFLKEQLTRATIAGAVVFLMGIAIGQAARRTPAPIVIQRSQNPALTQAVGTENKAYSGNPNPGNVTSTGNAVGASSTEEIYTCGARTKKGSPCTRRVHGPVRCWQHLGLPAMLPQDQLRIRAQ
jgi:hypothetical protein